MDQGLKEELGSRACVEGWVWPCHPPGVRGYTIKGIGNSWVHVGRKLIRFLFGGFCLPSPHFFFFLSWMRGDVTTRRFQMVNQEGKESSKPEKHCWALGLGEEGKSVNARIDDVKMQKDEEWVLKWNVKWQGFQFGRCRMWGWESLIYEVLA